MKKEQSSINLLANEVRVLIPESQQLRLLAIFEHAKELHKKEIIEACENFGNINGVDIKDYEQYYTKKYGQ